MRDVAATLPEDSPEITAIVISEKMPLHEYLSDGLLRAREQAVDLNAPW